MTEHPNAETALAAEFALTTEFAIDIDLRDEDRLHARLDAESKVDQVRERLAALNFRSHRPADESRRDGEVDLAVFAATGCPELASIFAPARP